MRNKTNVCRFCGRVFFSFNQRSCCPNCVRLEEEEFSKIENYLKRYPNSNALQIAQGLAISPFVVVRYIDEGRLFVNKGEFKDIYGGGKK